MMFPKEFRFQCRCAYKKKMKHDLITKSDGRKGYVCRWCKDFKEMFSERVWQEELEEEAKTAQLLWQEKLERV